MTPNKKIPSFCFESPWLKPFNLIMEPIQVATRRIRTTWTPGLAQDVSFGTQFTEAEAELTDMIARHLNREIIENIRAQDLVPIQPMDEPQGNLLYLDYNYGPMEEPIVYDDGSWSMSNTFEGVIGIKSEIRQHKLI